MSTPRFSVIIPTCHRNDLLANCLERLAPGAQCLPADQYEVIVSDDGSKSTAQQMIAERFPWAKWVEGPQRGPAANRNHGAKQGGAEWIVFTDDDCLPEANWLSSYAKFSNDESHAMEGSVRALGDLEQDMAECPLNTTGGNFWSANIAVRRSLFEKVGGFDVNFPYPAHEDTDLHQRLLKATKIPFISESIVLHPVRIVPLGAAIRALPKRYITLAYFIQKNRQVPHYRNNTAVVYTQLYFHLGRFVRGCRGHRMKSALVDLLSIAVGIPVLLLYLRRSRVQ